MVDNSLLNTTNVIQWLSIAFIVLLVLLVLTQAALAVLRRHARKQVSRTDLDLIGLQATVTHTIRPNKPGKISYAADDGGLLFLEAVSDQKIQSGKPVRIIAISGGLYRVLPEKRTSATSDTRPSDSQDRSES